MHNLYANLILCTGIMLFWCESAESKAIAIADLGLSATTQQAGLCHCIGARPDMVRDHLTRIGEPAVDAWRIELSADAPDVGVGAVLPLYNNKPGAGEPADFSLESLPTPRTLKLRLLGSLGSRNLRIELTSKANTQGELLADVSADKLDANQWRTISAPVDVTKVNRGAVRLLIEGEGPAWIAIDAAAFVSGNGEIAVDPPQSGTQKQLRKATWVWHTERIAGHASQTEQLLSLCKKRGLTDLFCQVPYRYEDGVVHIERADELRKLNRACRRQSITVHALDGGPTYVRRPNHQRMFALVDALAAFNQASPADARYDAIHLDNEPYVLPEWRDKRTRPALIEDYLTLNRELSVRTKAAGLTFGVDIPFWWDERDASGKPVFAATTDGADVPLVEAVFALVQNAGIMSYRERVTGPNGVVAHCLNEFELGARMGVDVFAAVELGTGKDVEAGTTFGRYSRKYIDEQLVTMETILSRQTGCAGIAIHHYDVLSAMEN